MSKRITLTALSLLIAAALLSLASCGGSEPERPTIVLITIDTLRADRIGAYGRENAGTPVLDRLAAEGALFEAAQTTAPITVPAHSSILTGRTLPAHGMFDNASYKLPESIPTLAESFRDAGYATGAFVSSQVLVRRYGLDRGFDHYDDKMPDARAVDGQWRLHFGERPGTMTADAAIEWLGQKGSRPAFLWVHFWEPHAPHNPPPEFLRMYPGDGYQAEVAAVDAAVGHLLEGIKGLGREEKLMVLTVADHGESLGEHGEQTHGIFLYQPVMHVPMIAWGPAFGIDPQVIEPVVSVADIAPTLVEIAGTGALGDIDGRSLALTLTTGAELAGPYAAFAESHSPRFEHGWSGLRAIVIGDEKLIDAPRKEYYDLAEDADESNDIAAQRPEDVQAAQELLDALVQEGAALAPDESSDAPVDEEQLAVLRSLGYAATGRRIDESLPLVDPEGIDPKDKIGVIRLYDFALVEREGKGPAAAIPHFAKLVEKDPTNPGFFFQYAQTQIMVRDLQGALDSLKSALELDPEFSLAWYRVGQIHDALKEYEAAEATYRRAFEVDPLAVDPRKALASLIADQGRTDEAIQILEEAQELAPNDREITGTLGRLRGARP